MIDNDDEDDDDDDDHLPRTIQCAVHANSDMLGSFLNFKVTVSSFCLHL